MNFHHTVTSLFDNPGGKVGIINTFFSSFSCMSSANSQPQSSILRPHSSCKSREDNGRQWLSDTALYGGGQDKPSCKYSWLGSACNGQRFVCALLQPTNLPSASCLYIDWSVFTCSTALISKVQPRFVVRPSICLSVVIVFT